MKTAADARALRERVLPDARLHHIPARSQNRDLRRGLWGVRVADRAAALLAEHCPPEARERLDELQAIAYLVGTLDLDTDRGPLSVELLQAEGYSTFVWLGVRLVQGQAFDPPASYWTALRIGFDHYKLVRGALAVAEVEDVRELAEAHPRRRKVLGDAHHHVLGLLETAGRPGRALADELARALADAGFREPHEPSPVAHLQAALGPTFALERKDGQVVVSLDGEAHCVVHLDPLRLEIEAEVQVCGPSEVAPDAATLERARRAMVELVGTWLVEAGFELEDEGEAHVAWLAARPEQEIHAWRATATRPLGSVEQAVEAIRAHRPSAWSFTLDELDEHLG